MRVIVRSLITILILQGLAVCVSAADSATDEARDFSGLFRTTYQFRSAGSEHDSDLYNYLYFNSRGTSGLSPDFYFSGRFHKDLDGNTLWLSKDVFTDIKDRDSGWESHVYQAYADFHDENNQVGLRLGRQYTHEAQGLHIDGAELRLNPRPILGGKIFFGRPVSFYTADSEDWAGGISLESRPWCGNTSRLTYVRYSQEPHDDDWFNFETSQRFGDEFFVRARGSVIDDEFEMAGLDFYYLSLDGSLDVVVTAHHWGGLGQQSRQYSPLFSVLGELEPYTFLSGRITKSLTRKLSISPGMSARLVQGNDRDYRNRQFGNFDLALIYEPNPNWSWSVAGEYWDVTDGERFWGLTGEVGYRPEGPWEACVGTAYMDYQYDSFSDIHYSFQPGDLRIIYDGTTTRISPDVYTVYGKVKYDFNKHLSMRVQGEFEDNSVENDNILSMRTSLEVRF